MTLLVQIFRSKTLLAALIVTVLHIPIAHADNVRFFELVLRDDLKKSELLSEAKRASHLLGIEWAPESVSDPMGKPWYEGSVINVQRGPNGSYKLAASIHSGTENKALLAEAQKHYPMAKIIAFDAGFNDVTYAYRRDNMRVFVLFSSPDWRAADAKAKELSKKAKVPYKTRELKYNADQGRLTWPADFREETLRGVYVPRVDNACGIYLTTCNGCWADRCLSVENSYAYKGLKSGLFIVVSGVDHGISYNFLSGYKSLAPDGIVYKNAAPKGIVTDRDLNSSSSK